MIQQFTDNIFLAQFTIKPGLGIELPACSVFLEYKPREFILMSPGPNLEMAYAEILKKGDVKIILAPNLMHHLSMPTAISRFPNAKIFLAPGLEKKRTDLQVSGFSLPAFKNLLGPQFEVLVMSSLPKLNEVLIFDKRSKTLIVFDLLFNIQTPKNFMTKLILMLMGTNQKLNVSRLLKRMIVDKEAYRHQVEEILKWDIQKLVLAHGEPLLKVNKDHIGDILKLKL